MAVMLMTNEFAVHKILRYQYGLYKRKKVLPINKTIHGPFWVGDTVATHLFHY